MSTMRLLVARAVPEKDGQLPRKYEYRVIHMANEPVTLPADEKVVAVLP